jgi:acyl transferase domain-containing protein
MTEPYEFEVHVTLAETTGVEAWASARGHKFHDIVLDRGAHPSQPMVSVRTTGSLAGVQDRVAAAVGELAPWGVRRVKVEVEPRYAEQPGFAPEPGTYFEHHVKLLVRADEDLAGLKGTVPRHHAHLSRNARRQRPDGREQFVTQRTYGDRADARERLNALLAALSGWTVLSVEEEYVLSDSHVELDAGWLEGTG